jgi:hypothetical protein
MQYAPQPLPNQALHWQQEARESPSAPRTRVSSPAPASDAPELQDGGAR